MSGSIIAIINKKLLHGCFYSCFIVLNILCGSLCAQTLSTKIDALIQQKLPHATIGVLVKDAKTGQIIYRHNADKLLPPASGMKLLTAISALYQFKANYHFLTTLSQKQQHYYLTFRGDPSLTEAKLIHLLDNLKNNNVKIIHGNIVLDTSHFQPPFHLGGASVDDLGWYYAAADTAAILNGNAIAYDFISAPKQGELIQIAPKKNTASITLINQVITVSKEQAKEHCSLHIDMKPNNTLQLYGCLAQSHQPITMQLAVPDPVLLIQETIKTILNQQGIIFKGQILIDQTPKDTTLIANNSSEPLSKLITHMLRESDNLYASSLTKELAYALTHEGTNKQGAFAIKTILSQHTHLDLSQIDIADGVGTRYNMITAELMVTLLTDLYHDSNRYPILLAALPQSGVSGTLQDRLKKTVLEKVVYAKTGSMHDISSLSGYLIRKNATPLIFSIMINGVNQPIQVAKALEDQILLAIVTPDNATSIAKPLKKV